MQTAQVHLNATKINQHDKSTYPEIGRTCSVWKPSEHDPEAYDFVGYGIAALDDDSFLCFFETEEDEEEEEFWSRWFEVFDDWAWA